MPALPCSQGGPRLGKHSCLGLVCLTHTAEAHAETLAEGRISDQIEPMGAMLKGDTLGRGMHLQGTEKKPTFPNPSSSICQSLEYIGIILYSQEIL